MQKPCWAIPLRRAGYVPSPPHGYMGPICPLGRLLDRIILLVFQDILPFSVIADQPHSTSHRTVYSRTDGAGRARLWGGAVPSVRSPCRMLHGEGRSWLGGSAKMSKGMWGAPGANPHVHAPATEEGACVCVWGVCVCGGLTSGMDQAVRGERDPP